jgi:hypothetical protein
MFCEAATTASAKRSNTLARNTIVPSLKGQYFKVCRVKSREEKRTEGAGEETGGRGVAEIVGLKGGLIGGWNSEGVTSTPFPINEGEGSLLLLLHELPIDVPIDDRPSNVQSPLQGKTPFFSPPGWSN